MSASTSNLEIQGSFMRVPPPKELTKSLERRRSSEETQKSVVRPSIPKTDRSPVNNSPTSRKTVPPKPTVNKSDETEVMKTKITNLEDEIRRLKRRIEELEKEIADLQKQVKTKDKRIAELIKENDEFKKRVI